MFKFALIACLLVLAGCSRSSTPKSSVDEIAGSTAERVAGVSAIISKHRAPPTPILDAHFLEEQMGDGVFGPSDYREFYVVEVAPQDLTQWTRLLAPLAETPEYTAPDQPLDWWMTRDDFASLQFYEPGTLTGRIHGWIGVSQQTGRIYIFAFTM